MNAVIDACKSRRSVRAYQDRAVPRELVEQIIDAGNWAPCGHNNQSWRFVVVQDPGFRRQLVEATCPTWEKVMAAWMKSTDEAFREYLADLAVRTLGWPPLPYEEMMRRMMDEENAYFDAPLVIFVIGPLSQDCSLACENMMLAAQSLGLGSCMVGFGAQVMDDPEVVAALEIQGAEKIHGPIIFGYPRIVPEPPRKKPPVVKWI